MVVQVDATVQQVIDTWAARMIVQGIDYNDFVTTQRRIHVWDDWCREWSATADMHAGYADEHAARGEVLSSAEANFRAAIAYHFAVNNFVHDRDQYLRGHDNKVERYRRAAPHFDPPAEPHTVPFDGYSLAAYLRRPRDGVRAPVVVIISGVDSVKEEHRTMEDGFLQRGLATFSFDGPGQGETWAHSGMILDFERATSAVLDYLERVPDVDGRAVGLFGPSMGGYLAARSAAFDTRVRACAVSGASYDRNRMRRSVLDGDPFDTARMRHLYKIEDVPTLADLLYESTLDGVASRITCPLLVCHGTQDFVPLSAAQKLYAEASGPKQLLVLDGGNHVSNNLPYRYRPAVWDFLKAELD